MSPRPPRDPYQLMDELVDAMRRINVESLDALQFPEKRQAVDMDRRVLWARAKRIGSELRELGGLDLMHEAVQRVRRYSANMSDALESSWSSIAGYQKRRWLP